MPPPVAPQRRTQSVAGDQRRSDRLREPLTRLERPAAAERADRIGRERGVADERPAVARGAPPLVREVELADHRPDPRRGPDRRGVRQGLDEGAQLALRIALERGRARVVDRERHVLHQARVGRRDDPDVRLEEPEVHACARAEPGALEVAHVGEAVVARAARAHAEHSRDLRAAPVGAHQQPPAQLDHRAVARPRGDERAVGTRARGRHRVAREQRHARRPRRGPAHDRVEHLAPQVERLARSVRLLRRAPAVTRPYAGAPALGARREHRVEDAEAREHRHPARLDVVPADPLEGGRVRVLLDKRHPGTRPGEEDRRAAPRQARAHHDRVMLLSHRRPPVL